MSMEVLEKTREERQITILLKVTKKRGEKEKGESSQKQILVKDHMQQL